MKRKDEDLPEKISRPGTGTGVLTPGGNNSGKSSDLRSRLNRSNQLNLVTEPSALGKKGRHSRMSR